MNSADAVDGVCRQRIRWQTDENHSSAGRGFRVGPSRHIRDGADCGEQGASDDRRLREGHHFWLGLAGHRTSAGEHERGRSRCCCGCGRYRSRVFVLLRWFVSAWHCSHCWLVCPKSIESTLAFASVAVMLSGSVTLTVYSVFMCLPILQHYLFRGIFWPASCWLLVFILELLVWF